MRKLLNLSLFSVIVSSVIIGCGGENNTSIQQTNTGYFIDAAVAGLDYNTSSNIKGTTDQYGRFSYIDGDSVNFRIGNLDLGEAIPQDDGLVTPEELAKGDEVAKIMILRVLQSIDSDNNTSNGITVPKEIATELKKLTKKIDIKSLSDDDEDLLKLNKKLSEKLDKNHDGHIDIDESEAKKHFEKSLQKWEEGQKPDHNKNDHNGDYNDDNDNNTHSDFDNPKEGNNSHNNDDEEKNNNSDFDQPKTNHNKNMNDNDNDNDNNTHSDFDNPKEGNNSHNT